MILVFGGTTEGRKAVKELEEAGKTFFYSTKGAEQQITLHYGKRLQGAMEVAEIIDFCNKNAIRLLIDASHPFAERLHYNVATVATQLDLPAIRFERIAIEHDTEHIIWCDTYDEAIFYLRQCNMVLALTGVQSISKLLPLKSLGITMRYRILNRKSSIEQAYAQGALKEELLFLQNTDYLEDNEKSFATSLKTFDTIQATFQKRIGVILKESGLSGGFKQKAEKAIELGWVVVALRRPKTPKVFHCVDGEHGLRRMVEQFLPEFFPLRSGLTTGTCATAAAVAHTLYQITGTKYSKVPVILPNGETISVDVFCNDTYASVKKDAGDDPDVTQGAEIRASVSFPKDTTHLSSVHFIAGKGVGTITLPGFDYPPGDVAINKAPRQMIIENLSHIFTKEYKRRSTESKNVIPKILGEVAVTISVPGGERLVRRTFNMRLGITDGISIVGVSGIVKPYSADSFLASIKRCMEVAKACNSNMVVINSGGKSERQVKTYYPFLPAQSFVEYGNHIGQAIHMAHQVGIRKLTIGVMIGKAMKLAAGYLDTHSKNSSMNKEMIKDILREAGCSENIVEKVTDITLFRELWTIVPPSLVIPFCRSITQRCLSVCLPLFPLGQLTFLVVRESGVIYDSSKDEET